MKIIKMPTDKRKCARTKPNENECYFSPDFKEIIDKRFREIEEKISKISQKVFENGEIVRKNEKNINILYLSSNDKNNYFNEKINEIEEKIDKIDTHFNINRGGHGEII